jgi:hypothetical protein
VDIGEFEEELEDARDAEIARLRINDINAGAEPLVSGTDLEVELNRLLSEE